MQFYFFCFFILYLSYKTGFLKGILDILILAVSFLADFYFYSYLASFFRNQLVVLDDCFLLPLSFFLVTQSVKIVHSRLMNSTGQKAKYIKYKI